MADSFILPKRSFLLLSLLNLIIKQTYKYFILMSYLYLYHQ
ncbi:putative membrane protein [Shigella boydii 5216-82]|nr:putative membrane protein [Shigella boydii 5216-82]EIQ23622.1 putative membrane protein [Shigella boydii 965-58]